MFDRFRSELLNTKNRAFVKVFEIGRHAYLWVPNVYLSDGNRLRRQIPKVMLSAHGGQTGQAQFVVPDNVSLNFFVPDGHTLIHEGGARFENIMFKHKVVSETIGAGAACPDYAVAKNVNSRKNPNHGGRYRSYDILSEMFEYDNPAMMFNTNEFVDELPAVITIRNRKITFHNHISLEWVITRVKETFINNGWLHQGDELEFDCVMCRSAAANSTRTPIRYAV